MERRTWPSGSDGHQAPPFFTTLHFSEQPQQRSSCRDMSCTPSNGETTPTIGNSDFSALPYDLLRKIGGSLTITNLWSASMVCRSWREGLEPLREAMVLVRWGKRFKHGSCGVGRNTQKALDSFLKGALHGSSAAMVDAGLLYWEMGKKEEGIALYKEAAVLGDPSGQCNLGISYLQAEPPNPEEAVKWFYRAANVGHARAQYCLALCLHQGHGIKSNLREAAKWYLRAAEGGSKRAMYNTALCYQSGEGSVCNYRQSRKWMKRAAESGHSKAQFEHGLRLFSEGDKAKALVYLELACRAGETAAGRIKSVLLQQMPPSLRDRVMLTADNWHAVRRFP